MTSELGALGRPMLPTGITKVVQGARRVDVDDLMSLAIALDVSPLTLLLPREKLGKRQAVTGSRAVGGRLWEWARGDVPLTMTSVDDVAEFRLRSMPEGFRRLGDLAAEIDNSWSVRGDESAETVTSLGRR